MTENTPYASRKLIRAMRKSIIAEICHPFEGEMRSQNGVVQGPDGARLEASQIVDMNWLNENIDGTLPSWDELTENAKRAVIANGLPLADDME